MTCETCRWWSQDAAAGDGDVLENGEGAGNSGECRIRAPALILAMDPVRLHRLVRDPATGERCDDCVVDGSRRVFPLTCLWDWCGEYAARDGGNAAPDAVTIGGVRVGVDDPLTYSSLLALGLSYRGARGVFRAVAKHVGALSVAEVTLRRVCEVRGSEFWAVGGVGPKTAADVKGWLAGAGLAMRV